MLDYVIGFQKTALLGQALASPNSNSFTLSNSLSQLKPPPTLRAGLSFMFRHLRVKLLLHKPQMNHPLSGARKRYNCLLTDRSFRATVSYLSNNLTMLRAFIGIPIVNRLDLLKNCVETLDISAEILIINNNPGDKQFNLDLHKLAQHREAEVLCPPKNLGVAASWNLIIRNALSRGYDRIFIGSNDTSLHPGSLEAALNFPNGKKYAVLHLHAFNFFLLHESAIRDVGWFDENFYPAYKEDQDYAYRCYLAGVERLPSIPGCCGYHVGSATIHSDPAFVSKHQHDFDKNGRYYVSKWGGDSGSEIFAHPYNDASYDHRLWREAPER